jgi:phosphotransferase system HPr-like phosphotransfer protein
MKRTVKLNNPHGLHCRPSSELVTLSKKFDANVFIVNYPSHKGRGFQPKPNASK